MFDDLANFGFSEEYCTNVTFKNEGKKLANYATSVARAAVDLALEQTEFSPDELSALVITEDTIQELFLLFSWKSTKMRPDLPPFQHDLFWA